MKTIKILFVEDHEMVRNGIKLMLKTQNSFIAEIDEAVDGLEAIEKASKNNYDVILLDINLPQKDGIFITRLLTSKQNKARILALSMHKEGVIIKKMLEAGALGYILKNSSLEELTKAILTVYNFERYYSNEVAQTLIQKTDKMQCDFFDDIKSQKISSDNNITQRELEVLKYIASGDTNKEIGEKLNISARTVGNHRNKLLQKLLVKNSIGLATYAIKNGLV